MHNTSLWKEMYTNNETVSYLSVNNASSTPANLQSYWTSLDEYINLFLCTPLNKMWKLHQMGIRSKCHKK